MNRDSFACSGIAVWLMLAGLGLALFSSLAGLLPWPMGLWQDSEPIALAVHAGAALAALGLAGVGWLRPWLMRACLCHPFVAAPLALAVWSLVAVPGAADPAAALLGSPQTAEGPLLFADGALFIAAGLVLRHQSGAAAVLGWMALAAAAVLPWLVLFPATTIYFFGAWMVFPAIAAPIVVLVFLTTAVPNRRTRLLLAAAAGLPGWVLSDSITAIAAGLLALPAVWLASRADAPRPCRYRLGLAGLVLAVPLVLELGTLAFAMLYCGSVKPELRALESVWSRGHLQWALLTDFCDHPWRALIGAGWGQIGDMFGRTVTAAGLPLWSSDWDMMTRDVVNSHHFLLEALLAAGIPGLLLRVAGLAVVPVFCPPPLRLAAGLFALALATLGALWFQLPGTVAMVALGIAAFGTIAPPNTARPNPTVWGRWGLLGVLAAFGVMASVVVVTLAREEVVAGTLEPAYIAPQVPPPLADCDAWRLSGWRAPVYLAGLLGRTLKDFRNVAPPATQPEASLLALANLVCLSGRPGFQDRVPVQTFVLALRGDITLLAVNKPYRSYFPGFAEGWDRQIWEYLARAPRRTDIAIPYLVWLDRQGRFAELFQAIDRMSATNPDDPVPLWYSGAALTRQPGRMGQGFDRMRRALETGIDLRIEVAPNLRRQIQQGPHDGG